MGKQGWRPVSAAACVEHFPGVSPAFAARTLQAFCRLLLVNHSHPPNGGFRKDQMPMTVHCRKALAFMLSASLNPIALASFADT